MEEGKLTEFVARRPTLKEWLKGGILKNQKGSKNKNMDKYNRLFFIS